MNHDVFFSVDVNASDESTQTLLEGLRAREGVLGADYLFGKDKDPDLKVHCFARTASAEVQNALLAELMNDLRVINPHVPSPRYLKLPVNYPYPTAPHPFSEAGKALHQDKSSIIDNGDVTDASGNVIGKRG